MNWNSLISLFCILGLFPLGGMGQADLAPASTVLHSFETNMVMYSPARSEYSFDYQDGGELIEYNIRTNDPFIEQGMISLRARINGERTLIPLQTAGLLIRTASGRVMSPTQITASGACRFVTHFLEQGSVHFSYEETLGDSIMYKDFRFSIKGKTLIVNASSHTVSQATTGYIGFDFGQSIYTPVVKVLQFPSSPVPVVHTFNTLYLSTYVDPLLSTTARYEKTVDIASRRNAQVSNTPAWLLEGNYGVIPHLDLTAYITISTDWKDVVPSVPSSPKRSEWTPSFVLDMNGLPMAQRPYLPMEIIRKWTAPDSGRIKLNGAISLLDGVQSQFEVRIQRANRENPIVMYSQQLDPAMKPVAGLKGEFPVEEGDQLLFVCSSPAVMNGGLVGVNMEFELNDKRYSSQDDFHGVQGTNGWFYEQQRGPFSSLLIWDAKQRHWESPDTRAWISKDRAAARRGAKGDAFANAALFLNEANVMGAQDFALITRNWDHHAAMALTSPDEIHSKRWGTVASLQNISKHEIQRGNAIVPAISLASLKQQTKTQALTHYISSLMRFTIPTSTSLTTIMDKAIEKRLQQLDTAMSYNALLFEGFPHPEGMYRYASTLRWLAGQHQNEPYLQFTDALIQPKITALAMPVLWQGDFFDDPRHWFWSRYSSGVIAAHHDNQNVGLLIDSEVEQANHLTRIGFSSIGNFFQSPSSESYVDASLNSNDVYLSALVAERRVPYLSDRYTHSTWTSHDIRKWMLESYALTAPAAKEYLSSSNPVETVQYSTKDGQVMDATDVLSADVQVFPERIQSQYKNGLKTYINRSRDAWTVPESFLPVVQIKQDGFLAINEQTGLIALMGITGSNEFTAARTEDTFFLHSRDGAMIEVPPLMTDGLVYIHNSEIPNKQNITALGITELRRSGTLHPILRATKKADLALTWKNNDTMELWVFDALPDPFLLELYDLPPEWLHHDSNELLITKRWEQQTEAIPETAWSVVKNGGIKGIRLAGAQGGMIYQIQRKSVIQQSLLPQQ